MAHKFGNTDADDAVTGTSKSGRGVVGTSDTDVGVLGESKGDKHSGVVGKSEFRGVHGTSGAGFGVAGTSESGVGVLGESKGDKHSGVVGKSGFRGVSGISTGGAGVYGETSSRDHAGVHGKGPRLAGFFEGDVEVTGDIRLLGADLAEQFDVVGDPPAQPGAVMVLAGGHAVRVSDSPYDRRVAGVVSGAGDLRPGLVLDNRSTTDRREALALSGKVWVLVDADQAPVAVGDLLTTSPTPGHAMRAGDPVQAFGAVIGKALDPLPAGRGQIRALVALQ